MRKDVLIHFCIVLPVAGLRHLISGLGANNHIAAILLGLIKRSIGAADKGIAVFAGHIFGGAEWKS